MSCGNPHETSCEEILNAMFIFLDHEIEDVHQYQAFELHFQECPPCQGTKLQEQKALSLIQSLLSRSCQEVAPEDLLNRIHEQTQALAEEMNSMHQASLPIETQVISGYTRTEISVDGVTQIIETSHEIRRDFF